MRPHYILRDRRSRCYLMEARQIDGPDHLLTTWDTKRSHAQRFPGMKSARRMARLLEMTDYEIVNINRRERRE